MFSCNRALRLFALLLLWCAMSACAQESEKASAEKLRTVIEFRCKWWSESQMEGLNPNSPPPKNTEVRLTKWEYSDPIGVPHPDTIDVVVALQNPSSNALSDLDMDIRVQWKIGPQGKQSAVTWSQPIVLKHQRLSVDATGQQTVRVPLDLKKQMDVLDKQEKWPFAVRAIAEIKTSSSVVSTAHAELPIKPGD